MHLIALLIGLVIERLATQLFHLRRLRWLERLIDKGLGHAAGFSNWPTLIPILVLGALLVLPVLVVTLSLGDSLLGIPYLVLSIVVLFFSLGPNDIGEDVNDYCDALEAGDDERIRQTAKAIVEDDVPEDALERCQCVEEAVVVQANNRLFAVIFWFVLLGPLGAWAYRVADLMRRSAVFRSARENQPASIEQVRYATTELQGWLAWVPARLTAIGYATAGHFDAAISAWRNSDEPYTNRASQSNERLLARVGVGALDIRSEAGDDPAERGVQGATAANRLVFRLLMIWAFVIALMTLYGWTL
ncbi:MAG: regulatory signaling modulator protein AmpE [Pseudomonadota bacterium]